MEINMEELYKDYKSDVFRFLCKLTNNFDLADNLTQETFYQAYKSISKFDGKSTFKTWLFSIAKNCYFMYIRKKKNDAVPIDEMLNSLFQDNFSMESHLFKKAIITDALTIIFSMKESMKTVFLARIYSEDSYAKISSDLGISESSAKVLFFRAKQHLQTTLREVYHYEI